MGKIIINLQGTINICLMKKGLILVKSIKQAFFLKSLLIIEKLEIEGI